ncbi:MAG: AgmX/PglI C-terminal domain-containing protein [Deltaproteobacteria bacterium]|nr:AgmX/PglI C-terminal domain-containing protein [Deltaproteobacteria bacterium]
MRGWRLVLPFALTGLAACPAARTAPMAEPSPTGGETGAATGVTTDTTTTSTTGSVGGVPGDGETAGVLPPFEQPTKTPDGSLPAKGPADRLPGKGNGNELQIGELSGLGTGLRRDDVQQVVRGQQQRLRSCWDRWQLASADPAGGTVSVRFTVEPAGTVGRTEIAAATITDPTFLECLRDVVKELRFPTTDAPTIITYPFRFENPAGEK